MKNWNVLVFMGCLTFAAVAAGQTLPINHDFEPPAFVLGPLPQQGWSGDGSIQNTVKLAGDQALQINADGQVDRPLESTEQVIYLDGYYRADDLQGNVPQLGDLLPGSSVLVFMANPGIVALNGDRSNGGTWLQAGVPLALGQFYRITIRQDYASQSWDLFVDGDPTPKLSDLGFKNNTVLVPSGLSIKAPPVSNSFLDDFYAGTAPPDFLIPTATPTVTHTPLPTSTPTDTSTPGPTSTPTPLKDTDGDGIFDVNEGGMIPPDDKTNMYLTDSDGDGLGDGVEDANRDGIWQQGSELNPRNRDTDGDGVEDGIEVLLGADPLNPSIPPVALPDADNDKLPDGVDPDPTTNDSDGDRFADAYEAVKIGIPAVSDPGVHPTLGDVDENDNWDNGDAQLIRNFLVDDPTPGFNPDRSDLNRDGKIDGADAQTSLGFYVEEVPILPE
jgi:hypothetical protein